MIKSKDEVIEILIDTIQKRAMDWETLNIPSWTTPDWHNLMVHTELRELFNGELLLRRADRSRELYFLAEGELEVSEFLSATLSISPIILIGPGSIVGEISFFDGNGRSASVWSRGTSRLLGLPQAAFEEWKREYPLRACDLLFAIGRIVVGRIRNAHARGVTRN